MRIVIVVQNLPVPFDRRVWLEATTLARHGHSVTVICPKAKGFDASAEIIEDVAIRRYPLPIDARGPLGFIAEFVWCFIWTSALFFRILWFGRGCDVLQACNPPEIYWPLGLLMRGLGKVFIFDHHDLSPEMYDAKFAAPKPAVRRALLWLERRTFRAAQIVITTNESHRRIAIARGGKAAEDIYVVRSGPDLARFTRFPPDPSWSKGKRHLIVYLGEICRQDGVEHLVQALKLLRDGMERRDFHCVLLGGGSHQPALRAYAAELGVADLTTFTGRVSDEVLCRVLSSATIAVDPSPKTPWSNQSTMNKIIEYMYFGLPIAAYDLAESRVSAADAALYADAEEPLALARAIARLLDDPELRQDMSSVGAARVRDRLAWEYSVPHLIAAYDHAAILLARRMPQAVPNDER